MKSLGHNEADADTELAEQHCHRVDDYVGLAFMDRESKSRSKILSNFGLRRIGRSDLYPVVRTSGRVRSVCLQRQPSKRKTLRQC